MKILHIHTDDRGGGATNLAKSLSDQAAIYDSQVFWLVASKHSNDANVDALPFSRWRKRWSQLRGSDLSGFLSSEIFKHRFYQQADLVHLHNLHGYYFDLALLPRLCREKKVIWTFHDLWPLTASCSHTESWDLCDGLSLCRGSKLYPRFLFRQQRQIIRQKLAIYDQSNFNIVAPCQWMQDKVKQSALADKPCQLIYNGIDQRLFSSQSKSSLLAKLQLPADKKIAIFLADGGSTNRWKGWPYFESVRARYSDQLFFISIGHHDDDLVKRSDYWQLPYLDQIQVAEYLGLADIFLFTSVAENFPLAVLEAMSAGLPIISFDVGGVKEVLSHQNSGYLAAANDLADFSQGLTWFLSLDDQKISTIAKFNQALIASKFTSQSMADNYYRLYQSLLNSK